ncbi:MBL fold metallo-hydrolase [Capillimicrobium parvum]|uniref:Hydroxyacylglutathione hydrolase n=1 Tax=Capillimicrobium parvum TaxID=2884022 RepID=A0A9E6Y296_9ACTN|nr:MBL fold metallo-hydrolase [Capillimicrobium parvum]UGS38561.1 Hydroxyacylglutathione hydrolase [Capillimicrobium parvum]
MKIAAPTTIAPRALLARLVAGEPTAVLDVRADADAPIEAAAARLRHVPAGEATEAAGALAAELAADTVVVCHRGLSARGVAEALCAAGMEAPQILDGGMRGWLHVLRAVPVDLGVEGLQVRQVQRPGRGCLSYVLAAGGEALVVDPAPDAAFYRDVADELGARIVAVFDTHLHADHLSGARELAASAGAALHMPQASIDRGVAYADEVQAVRDGDVLTIGGIDVTAIALPGHTTDMTGLLLAGRVLLSGDSLFADGLARPDLERGDPDGARVMARTLHTTLHERVLALGDDVVLLPGHDHAVVRTGAVAPRLGDVRARVAELSIADSDEFAEHILQGMPPRPANYAAVIDANAGRTAVDPDLESGGNSCATR